MAVFPCGLGAATRTRGCFRDVTYCHDWNCHPDCPFAGDAEAGGKGGSSDGNGHTPTPSRRPAFRWQILDTSGSPLKVVIRTWLCTWLQWAVKTESMGAPDKGKGEGRPCPAPSAGPRGPTGRKLIHRSARGMRMTRRESSPAGVTRPAASRAARRGCRAPRRARPRYHGLWAASRRRPPPRAESPAARRCPTFSGRPGSTR